MCVHDVHTVHIVWKKKGRLMYGGSVREWYNADTRYIISCASSVHSFLLASPRNKYFLPAHAVRSCMPLV